MKEIQLNDVSDIKFVFDTLSKQKVMDVFNYHCQSVFQIHEKDLIVENDKLILNVDLSKWKNYPDIDFYNAFDSLKNIALNKEVPSTYNDYCFLNVVESLCRITNPKGGTPLTYIGAILTGHDNQLKSDFIFKDTFYQGKHTVIGTYDSGMKVIYTNKTLFELL